MEINQWLKLVEYGDHPHPEGIQRVTKEAAIEMQRKFHSLRARLARKFGGIPIYIGHPDDESFARLPGHNDTRSYAWVQDIEARDDGIWILPRWSEAGKTMIENSYFKFLSPRWEMKRESNVLIPFRLISVGLTNYPNIPGDAIANQETIPDDPEIPEAIPVGATTSCDEMSGGERVRKKDKGIRKNRKKIETQNVADASERDPQLLQQIGGLLTRLFAVDLGKPAEEIEGRLKAVAEQARSWREEGETLKSSNGELASESERFYRIACEKERQVKELSEQLQCAKNLSGEYFVNSAVNRGLILPNESVEWKEKYVADPQEASNELLKRSRILNTTSKTEHLRQKMNANGKTQILALVNERMESSGENYTEAWNAIKKLHPALF
ncbi:MAG: hypothetical protein LBQ03_00030 [Puniceicoccales bacterium]|jgi:hypothetical protein|nr:hypothetical protein [Puniceicoccales bacterium]